MRKKVLLPRPRVLAVLLFTCAAQAQQAYVPRIPPQYKGDTTALEIAQLPEMCYWQYVDGAFAGNPRYSIQGCGDYVNHYCPGLIKLMRATSPTRPLSERKENIRMAVADFEYTLGSGLPASCPHKAMFMSTLQQARMQQQLIQALKR
jgi:hypothetical protein